MFKDYQRPLREMLERICRDSIASRGCARVVDVGCANGTVAFWLKGKFPPETVRYVGVDPSAMFLDDARAHFPHHTSIQSDCAGLARITLEQADVAVISGVLCFISPRDTITALTKARDVAPYVIIRDFFGNTGSGEVGAFYHHEGFPMFAHDFDLYAGELGLSIMNIEESPTPDDRRGFATALLTREVPPSRG